MYTDRTLQERRDARSASRQCARNAPTQDALRKRAARSASARSAKREARSAKRGARSAKRKARKIYILYGRPGRLLQRAACVRLSSVSNGATSLGRQGHRASPAAPATQGACTELEPSPRGRGFFFSSLVASVLESEVFRARRSRKSSERARVGGVQKSARAVAV